ncbi:MAG TPA: SDR family oxidoreductase [Bacilli bacterium]|nr:SDR family oxidoreductase [Bacilli bacterium]
MGRKWTGKIAIVTGASRLKGIGAAICKALAAEGADIFFTYWTDYDKQMPWGSDQAEPHTLQEEIRALGVRCESVEVDLADPKTPGELFELVEKTLGSPSVLVNNACYSVNDGYEAIEASLLDRHYEINVRATTMMSVEFARRFSQGSGGRVINITSGQSKGPMVGEIAYATTKGAIDAMTVTLAAEVATKGITVNAVNPGATDTGWMTSEIEQALLPSFPFGRVGKPQDVARLVAFLASEEAGWITGQVMHSEGGFVR